jgi:hypothetical protein
VIGKERTAQTQLNTKFAAKLSFMPKKNADCKKKTQNKIFLNYIYITKKS